MRGTWRDRLKNLFDVRGLGWQLVIALVAVVVGALGIGTIVFWESLRDALSDFFTTDLEVWHLLIALAVEIFVGLVVIVLLRRLGPTRERASWKRYYPREIDHFDVLWPITAAMGAGLNFRVGKPMCPKCRTPLGLDFGARAEPFSLGGDWNDTTIEGMEFRCSKDGLGYDLTKYSIPMSMMTKTVEDLAWGEYRTAARGAGQ